MKKNTKSRAILAGALMATLVIPASIGMTAQAEVGGGYFKIKAEDGEARLSSVVGADKPLTPEEQAEKDRIEAEKAEAAAVAKEVASWEDCGAVLPNEASRDPYKINRIAFGGGKFFVSDGEQGWKSSDGCSWGEKFSSGGNTGINVGDMTYGPAGFLAATSAKPQSGTATYPFVHIDPSGVWYMPNKVKNNPSGQNLVSMEILHLAATPTSFVAATGNYSGNPGVYIAPKEQDYQNRTRIAGSWTGTTTTKINFGMGAAPAKALASSTTQDMVVFSNAKGLGHLAPIPNSSLVDSAEGELPGNWTALNWANGTFTALSADGKQVATSTDGKTWSVKDATGLGANYKKLVQGGGYYVAVNQLNNKVATSKDGVKWKEYSLPGINATAKLNDVEFGNGKFVVVANLNSGVLQLWDLELDKLK